MRHRTAISLLSLCLLTIGGGCSTPRSRLADNIFSPKSNVAKSKATDSRFMSLFKRNQKKPATALPSLDENQAGDGQAIRQVSGTSSDSRFDTKTQVMIDEALVGASPAKQAEMREVLRSVPAENIPDILKVYKLSQPQPGSAPGTMGHRRGGPPTLANQGRSLDRLRGQRPPERNQFGSLNSGTGLGQQNHSSAYAGSNYAGANNSQTGTRQGYSNNEPRRVAQVVPAGGRVDISRNNSHLNQADYSTSRNPTQPNQANRISDSLPTTGSRKNPYETGPGLQQTQYGEPQPSVTPANDLPLYRSGRNTNAHRGNLTPGMRPPIATQTAQTTGQQNILQVGRQPDGIGNAPPVQQAIGGFDGRLAWRSHLEALISNAEREVAQLKPGMGDDAATRDYIENNVYLRMLYLMSGQQDQKARAWEPIVGIAPAQQGFWQDTFFGITNYFDRNPELMSGERFGQTVKSFAHATSELRKAANLEVGDIAFCSGITNFGNYKRFETYKFEPGQHVALYAEIRNFVSQSTDDNNYRALLQSTIEFLTPGRDGPLSGRTVSDPGPWKLEPTEDLCKYPRNDFYIAYEFDIPRNLPQGPYVLKLTVTDQLGEKVSESTVNFVVQ